MELGKNIAKFRNINNLKAKQLADMAEIDQSYLSQIENGKRSPSLDVLQKIAKALHVTVSELLGEVPEQFTADQRKLINYVKELDSEQIYSTIQMIKAFQKGTD